jgi:hypothetical protein
MIAWTTLLVYIADVKGNGPYFKRNFCKSDMMILILDDDTRGACGCIGSESDVKQEDQLFRKSCRVLGLHLPALSLRWMHT